jgi:hypothetical protein
VSAARWPLVEVEWSDAHSVSGWDTPARYRSAGPAVCRSVGYLLLRDRDRLVLMTTGDVADGLAIPACAVRRVRRLR